MRWGGIAGVIQDNGSYERGWLLGYVNRKFSFALSRAKAVKNWIHICRAPSDFQDNHWYHVVGTYDSDTNATRLFVNGKLEASAHCAIQGAYFLPLRMLLLSWAAIRIMMSFIVA